MCRTCLVCRMCLIFAGPAGYLPDAPAQGLSQHPGCGLVGCHRLCTSHSRARLLEGSRGGPGGVMRCGGRLPYAPAGDGRRARGFRAEIWFQLALPQRTAPGQGIEPPAPTSGALKGVCGKNPSRRDRPPLPHSTWHRPDPAGPHSKTAKTGAFQGIARPKEICAHAPTFSAPRGGLKRGVHPAVWAAVASRLRPWPLSRSGMHAHTR